MKSSHAARRRDENTEAAKYINDQHLAQPQRSRWLKGLTGKGKHQVKPDPDEQRVQHKGIAPFQVFYGAHAFPNSRNQAGHSPDEAQAEEGFAKDPKEAECYHHHSKNHPIDPDGWKHGKLRKKGTERAGVNDDGEPNQHEKGGDVGQSVEEYGTKDFVGGKLLLAGHHAGANKLADSRETEVGQIAYKDARIGTGEARFVPHGLQEDSPADGARVIGECESHEDQRDPAVMQVAKIVAQFIPQAAGPGRNALLCTMLEVGFLVFGVKHVHDAEANAQKECEFQGIF